MKKITAMVVMALILQSCGPGKWVAGNQRHFQQRAAAKAKKQQAIISIK